MNTQELGIFLSKIHPVLKNNVFAANRLPMFMTPPVYLISNLDPDTKPGSHWIAIYIDANGVGEYFDTFARKPTGSHLLFLKRNVSRWTYNNRVIQNIFSSLCGEYCLMYLYLRYRGITLRNFAEMFTENTIDNDALLKIMFRTFYIV